MRIFLDANVLFSAAKSDGAVRLLLTRLLAASHECWADAYVAEEARRNLAIKAQESLPALATLLARLRVAAAHPRGPMSPALLRLPEKDRPILAAAIRLRCAALVTGDRAHFGAFYGQTIDGVTIHSPRSMAEALLR